MSDVMKQVELGEVASFIRGITFKPKDIVELGTDNSVACFRTKNVQKDLDLRDVWAVPRTFVKQDIKLLKHGDLLVSTANSWNLVGKCSWIPKLDYEATLGGFISALRPDITEVVPRYLYHWFAYGKTQANVRKCARQTTNISNLNIQQCLSIKIPLPPLPEQKRIAAILDQADALIRLRQKSLDRLNQLGQAIFYDMFGREGLVSQNNSSSFSDIAHIQIGYPFKSNKYIESSDGVLLCRGANILPNKMDWSNIARYPEIEAQSQIEYSLSNGDVVIAMDRPWIKSGFKVAKISENDIPSLLVQRVARLRAKESWDREFVLFLVQSNEFQRYCRPTETTIPHISPNEIRSFLFTLPSDIKRKIFADRLKTVNSQTEAAQKALDHSKTLFAALQQRAFKGAL